MLDFEIEDVELCLLRWSFVGVSESVVVIEPVLLTVISGSLKTTWSFGVLGREEAVSEGVALGVRGTAVDTQREKTNGMAD